ncbi:MAG: hybrid sensor histidine kinase/response regulator, partial [Mesorhizobium sp.]|uniref:PAS-domain containing protein n=1 Tax=Mesorhizobium sp. TaxID=1871066 RepID=UPI001224411E
FYDFWKIDPLRATAGCGFRELMEASRDADPYGADEVGWQRHIAEREAEIRAGVAGSRQLPRNDGRVLIASLAPLAGGKRLISYVDITDMKHRETEAEDARKNLATVLESLPAGVIIYDRHDEFVFANRKLHDSLPALKPAWQPGRTLREALALGHSAGYFRSSGDVEIDNVYGVDKERWLDAMLKCYHLPNSSYERLNPDGRWSQVYDMRADDGTFIGVRVDISDLKAREKALRESMRQIDLYRHVMDELPVAAFIKAEDLT